MYFLFNFVRLNNVSFLLFKLLTIVLISIDFKIISNKLLIIILALSFLLEDTIILLTFLLFLFTAYILILIYAYT